MITDYNSIAQLLLREFGNNWHAIHRALEYNGFDIAQFDEIFRRMGANPQPYTPNESTLGADF